MSVKTDTNSFDNSIVPRNKARIEWVDSLRAVAMIFVIYGHMYQNFWQYLLFTSPVKIPLFFAISGYLFKNTEKPPQKVKKLAVTILVPYFFLSLFPFKLAASFLPFTGIQTSDVLGLFFFGEYLWYLPCCFLAETVFYFVTKYSGKNAYIIAWVICITVTGLALSKTKLGYFLYISNAMISQIFLLIGFEIKKYEDKLNNINAFTLFLLIGVYILIGFLSLKLYPNQCMSAHENHYYNIPVCFSMIIIGCFSLIMLFKKFELSCRPLSFIGRNTLTYYAFNKYFRSPVIFIFEKAGILFELNWWIGILLTAGCCLVCVPISFFINKYLPHWVAKKRNIITLPLK